MIFSDVYKRQGVRKHTLDGLFDPFNRILFPHHARCADTQSTWMHRMAEVALLVILIACDFDLVSIDHDDIITAVKMCIRDRRAIVRKPSTRSALVFSTASASLFCSSARTSA